MYRLFVAVDLPDEIRNSVSDICAGIPGVKWIDPEQLHLTIRFIGDADEALFVAIRQELAEITGPPFTLSLRGVGRFPPHREPRVLWVGLERSGELALLRDQVEQALVKVGLEPEGRAFSPHITLARLREPQVPLVSRFLERNGHFSGGPFPVTEFHLYSSTLTRQGAIHRREASYPLAG